MMLRQHDLVTIRGVVELPKPAGGGIQVVLKTPSKTETRVIVCLDEIFSVELSSVQVGDAVSKKVAKGKAKGAL